MKDHRIQAVGDWVLVVPQHFTDDCKLPVPSLTGNWFPKLSMDIIGLAYKVYPLIERAAEFRS